VPPTSLAAVPTADDDTATTTASTALPANGAVGSGYNRGSALRISLAVLGLFMFWQSFVRELV
jgi:hypothetical protein